MKVKTKSKAKQPPQQQKPKQPNKNIPNPSTTKNKQRPKTLKSKSILDMTEAMADGINILKKNHKNKNPPQINEYFFNKMRQSKATQDDLE